MPKFIVRRRVSSDIEVEAADREEAELIAQEADLSEWDTYDSEITEVEEYVKTLKARVNFNHDHPNRGMVSAFAFVTGGITTTLTGHDGLLSRVEKRINELYEQYDNVEVMSISIEEDYATVYA